MAQKLAKYLIILALLVFSMDSAYAIKFRYLQNHEGLGKSEFSTDFRNYTSESGSVSSSQASYFGQNISSQETKMNRNASYHFVFSNTYGIGYTEIPMEHTFTLADGSQYVRDLRVNEIDVSLVLGSEGGNLTIGKGFLYGSSSKGDTAFLLLGYSVDDAKKLHEAAGFLPKLATLEVLIGIRQGKYYLKETAMDFGKKGEEEWKVDYKVYQLGLGARF